MKAIGKLGSRNSLSYWIGLEVLQSVSIPPSENSALSRGCDDKEKQALITAVNGIWHLDWREVRVQ